MVQSSTTSSFVKKTSVVIATAVCVSGLALAQSADDQAADTYAAVLQQISDLEVEVARKEVFLGTQEARIASLEEQLTRVEDLVAAVDPMLDKMQVAISAEIDADLPFNLEERIARLGAFQDILEEEGARPVDKMRRALGIYEAEVSYGQTVQSYPGDHPDPAKVGSRLQACQADAASSACALTKSQRERVIDKEEATIEDIEAELKDGDYLRYGRLSLAYMQADGSDVLRYDPIDKAWVEVKGNKALDVRRAVKMAKGEAAPTVVKVPVLISE